MFTLEQLLEQVNAYREGRTSFDEFEESYRNSSWGFYDRPGDALSEAISGVEAAFSAYEADGISEEAFQQELVDAFRPIASANPDPVEFYSDFRVESGNNSHHNVYGPSPQTVGSSSSFGFSHV
jgi:hypothetical protein